MPTTNRKRVIFKIKRTYVRIFNKAQAWYS